MEIKKLLIANRGEIAIRIARTAADMGIRTVAVFSEDDALSLHAQMADEAKPLRGAGAPAYLDMHQILAAATGCDAIHPGYGFLSENAEFARRCAEAGVLFVGPSPEVLDLFGDKTKARELALEAGVAIPQGINRATSREEAEAFFCAHGALMIKAVAGGGGRGMRVVRHFEELAEAYARCSSEASASFGKGDLYVEELISPARHIEVQIIGDGHDAAHVWERECSIQRQHQKLIEFAPSPSLSAEQREQVTSAAVRLARLSGYRGIGTFEFLMHGDRFVFLEANPRLQVEHTVTEEITGLDLVRIQLQLAAGARLAEFPIPQPRGFAIELRVNMETMDSSGRARPGGGVLTAFDVPSGPGVRVDTFGYQGYRTTPNFDSLLAKLIVHSPDPDQLLRRARRALGEFKVEGVPTNRAFLQNILLHPNFQNNQVSTRFIEEHLPELLPVDETVAAAGIEHCHAVLSPLQGTVIGVQVSAGEEIAQGQPLLLMEAMKMEHLITADKSGKVRAVNVSCGQAVFERHVLLYLEEGEVRALAQHREQEDDLDAIRPDLDEVRERHAITRDERRPEAVARRRKTGQRTARENIDALCDPGSFVEYGALVIAAQRRRRKLEELIQQTPADGLVTGLGTVNGSRAMVLAYDYTVLAGTQGKMNHKKTDRVLSLAEQWRLPVVLFAEGGGGRPGDTDTVSVGGLDTPSFVKFAKLSGQVPLVGIVSGYCFAGNAALVGCCDVIIATENSNIGMGGPAMIEGGGLGVFRPQEVGPIDIQSTNGVVDVRVRDEVEAVQAARKYLSYFQGPLPQWTAPDQRRLRRLIPENRLRVYDIRKVIETLADEDSVLELRAQFGIGMITALIRIEGRPIGLIANNPKHLSGAIDAPGADKASRFMQLCDAFRIPILSLCDTPGFMVGPEIEKQAQVRHVCRMYITGAAVSVPFMCVVLRKGYGLGAMAMAAGSFDAPLFTISWPTGEFGGMGLEGAVRLGFRRELEAVTDEVERKALYDRLVAEMYEKGKAINVASVLEIDAVIDPVETRHWIIRGLDSLPARDQSPRRNFVDSW